MTNGRVTQQDVARRAGTSQAAVSMVLNNAAEGRVSSAVVARIRSALSESGYLSARRSEFDRTKVIGVFTYESVFPSVAADFYYPFLIGVERAAEAGRHDLMLFTSASSGDEGEPEPRRQLDERRLRHVDGCILLGREVLSDDLARLNRSGFPYVSVGRRDDAEGPVPCVGADYRTGTRKLVERSMLLGHRRFLYVAHGSSAEAMRDRYRGFDDALRAGPEQTWYDRVPGSDVRQLLELSRRHRATCLVFEESSSGEALARLCLREGIGIGTDLSIVLLKEPQGRVSRVEFAHFSIPRVDMGRHAFEWLCRRITSPRESPDEPSQVLLPVALVEGSSLGPAPLSAPTT